MKAEYKFISIILIFFIVLSLTFLGLTEITQQQDLMIKRQQIIMDDYFNVVNELQKLRISIDEDKSNFVVIHENISKLKTEVNSFELEMKSEYNNLVASINSLIQWKILGEQYE